MRSDTFSASNITGDDALPKTRLLSARAAGEDTLLSDPGSGKVHFLNVTAALVWQCCDGNTTLDDCVRRLRETFAIPAEADVAADVQAVLADLEQRGLLAGDAADV